MHYLIIPDECTKKNMFSGIINFCHQACQVFAASFVSISWDGKSIRFRNYLTPLNHRSTGLLANTFTLYRHIVTDIFKHFLFLVSFFFCKVLQVAATVFQKLINLGWVTQIRNLRFTICTED